jgi:hypothetical protein
MKSWSLGITDMAMLTLCLRVFSSFLRLAALSAVYLKKKKPTEYIKDPTED